MLWAGKRGSSCDWGQDTMPRDQKRTGTEFLIVDNSDRDWKVANYLHEWWATGRSGGSDHRAAVAGGAGGEGSLPEQAPHPVAGPPECGDDCKAAQRSCGMGTRCNGAGRRNRDAFPVIG